MKKLSLKELNRASVEQFKNQEKTPIVLVLDNIRSGLNIGSAVELPSNRLTGRFLKRRLVQQIVWIGFIMKIL
jgi:hypothetical protein